MSLRVGSNLLTRQSFRELLSTVEKWRISCHVGQVKAMTRSVSILQSHVGLFHVRTFETFESFGDGYLKYLICI